MKKTLIAIAALVATGAFAQSTVTLSGSLDAGLVSTSQRGNSGFGYVGNLTSTSGFGLNVTNSLGGGMTAYGKMWSDVNPSASYGGSSNTGTTATNNLLGNSENKIGIRGAFGDLAFGAINDIGLESHLAATSFGTAIGSGTSITSRMNASDKARSDNTMAYNTPSMGGFSIGYVGRKQQTSGSTAVGVQASNAAAATSALNTATATGGNQAAVSQFALRYNAGPVNVILSRVTNDALNIGGNKDQITNLAGNYNLGAATVYFGSQGTVKTAAVAAATDSTRSALTVGLKYVFGANAVNASFGRVSEGNSLNAANTKGTKNFGLGYEYALSKQTSFVGRYDRVTDDIGLMSNAGLGGGATLTAGNQDRTRLGLGLRMAF